MDATVIPIIIIIVIATLVAVVYLRGERARAGDAVGMARLSETIERLAAMQSEQAGRLLQTQSGVNERLDAMVKRLGDGLAEQTDKTGHTLKQLHERLAVIDTAQKNLTSLSEQVVGLQDILSNKQARGAFGEIQLQDLVSAALPAQAYELQCTLSTRVRADCLLKLPNPPGAIVIDAKFPLESYNQLRMAKDETAKVQASRAFSADVITHVKAIQEKYIIPGETAESALMFLPSEAVYAELHANFRNVIEESFKRRVWIVSPTTLMATLTTVRAVLKDSRMREQAGVIQTEVMNLLKDVERLDKRVGSLQDHFRMANKDIEEISTSTGKIISRGGKIEMVQLGDDAPVEELVKPAPAP